jgi:predicted DNA-binding protein (MmcQ/YjbR family)
VNWDELRDACMALPGAVETFSFGPGCSVFKAPNGKMFGVSVTDTEPLDISVKCDPDDAVELRRAYPSITEGYHLNKKHWITVAADAGVPDELVRRLIADSYSLVTTSARVRTTSAI